MVSNMVDLNEILPKVLIAIGAAFYVVALFLDLRAIRKGREKNNDTDDD